jgi:hypothetical protein
MLKQLPEWTVSRWFNTEASPTLASLRGRVVVIHAFQMLCRGCVIHGVPQTQRVHQLFGDELLSVIGLHTVFEHHAAMTDTALAAFLHEFRVEFPVGVDQPSPQGGIPSSMARYQLQGTPTTLLVDAAGQLRRRAFGPVDDMVLGAQIAALLSEARTVASPSIASVHPSDPTPTGPTCRPRP